jgi:hypothetical protein
MDRTHSKQAVSGNRAFDGAKIPLFDHCVSFAFVYENDKFAFGFLQKHRSLK